MHVEDVALYTAGGDARLDAKFKMLLADKQLLSWILKAVVLEVGKYSYEEIAGFIEGEPEVGERPVHPNEKIEGRKNESSIVGEGVVTYDVIFDLVLPAVPKPLKIIVNVEGQNEFCPKPGYHLATRGVYYCARMISEQKNRAFFDSDYDSICKVYSIWLCFGAGKAENTITEFSIKPTRHFGNLRIAERVYDKLSVVLVCLPKNGSENELLQMLATVFSNSLSAERKAESLEEKGFHINRSLKGRVDEVCNYSVYIENRGIQKGMERGMERGMECGMERGMERRNKEIALKMLKRNIPDEDIMDMTGISAAELQALKEMALVTA